MGEIAQTQFKGLRTDFGKKLIGSDYFSNVVNFNCDDIVGANKVLFPDTFQDLDIGDFDVDGIYEYKYINPNSQQFITQYIYACNGILKVYENNIGKVIKSDIQKGTVTFDTLNGKLFIANGKSYPLVWDGVTLTQMGAPCATNSGIIGNVSGTYFYAMTYVVDGNEEVLGTVSNTIEALEIKVSLSLPIGYEGVSTRKIYRSYNGELRFLATISDNTTTTYIDDIADNSNGAIIPSVNNECPKPYFIRTLNSRLVGTVCDKYPTQLWVTESGIEVFDLANFLNVSNTSGDNTPVKGMALDYNYGVVASEKELYTLDTSGDLPTIKRTRANVGVKFGYSMVSLPAYGEFLGGVAFVSTMNDVRVFNGNYNLPVPTSLDNLKTDSISQQIINLIEYELTLKNPIIFGNFYKYRYHLIMNDKIFTYDIRTNWWAVLKVPSKYNVMFTSPSHLYLGLQGESKVEMAYVYTQYQNKDVPAILESGQLLFSDKYKLIHDFMMIFTSSGRNKVQVTITLDGDNNNAIVVDVELGGGAYSSDFFSDNYYEVDQNAEDFRVVNINLHARWVEYKIVAEKPFKFRGFKISYD